MGLFVGSFGDVSIIITSFSFEGGRDWTFQSPTRGDQHVGQDRGLRLRRTLCQLSFVGASYIDDLRRFDVLASSKDAKLFTHPVRGSYLAVCEGWQYEIDAETVEARGSCTFVELEEPKAVFPLGSGVAPIAGADVVNVTAEKADRALSSANLSSDAPDFAAKTVSNWVQDPEILPQEIQLQLASIISEIDDAIDTLQLAADHERYGAYKQMVLLRRQVFQAGLSVLAETDRIVDYTIAADVPLLTLSTRLYGGGLAIERATQLRQLNNIKTPGLLRAGTRIKVIAP